MHSCLSVVQFLGDPDIFGGFLPVNQTVAADRKSSDRGAHLLLPHHCLAADGALAYTDTAHQV